MSFEAALAIRQRLSDANPTNTGSQSALAGCHVMIGILRKEAVQPSEAMASLNAARVIQQKLADANPCVSLFQIELANTDLETAD